MAYTTLLTFQNRRDFSLDIPPIGQSYKTLEDVGMHLIQCLQYIDQRLGTRTYHQHGMRLYRWKLYQPYTIDLGDDKLQIVILPTMAFMPYPLKP